MTRQELLDLCLTFPDTYGDALFDDPNWTVGRDVYKRQFSCCSVRTRTVQQSSSAVRLLQTPNALLRKERLLW